jgi:hypothetical protein
MASIRVSYESERGCGYRKKGGLYLVGGKLEQPCGKLPLPLHVCPTCGAGVKPTRGWQWIKPRALFSDAVCAFASMEVAAPLALAGKSACRACVVGDCMPETAGLLWVGGAYYDTADAFSREAQAMGISRRIPALPKGFEPGKTVVYLAHRKVAFRVKAGVPTTLDQPAVFAAFIPRVVEYVVKGDETEEELDRLEKRGIELVDVKRQQTEMFEESES